MLIRDAWPTTDTDYDEVVHCACVETKAKVAALQYLSTPRMELKAAVLSAALSNTICEGHSFPIPNRFSWSFPSLFLSEHRRRDLRWYISHSVWLCAVRIRSSNYCWSYFEIVFFFASREFLKLSHHFWGFVLFSAKTFPWYPIFRKITPRNAPFPGTLFSGMTRFPEKCFPEWHISRKREFPEGVKSLFSFVVNLFKKLAVFSC